MHRLFIIIFMAFGSLAYADAPSQGLPSGVVDQIDNVLHPKPENSTAAPNVHRSIKLGHTDTGRIDFDEIYQEPFHRPLSGKNLYLSLDRNDLAQKYDRRAGARSGLIGGGIALITVGALAAAIVAGAGYLSNPRPADDASDWYTGAGVTAGVGIGSGLVMLITGCTLPKHPLNSSELEKVVSDYNRAQAAR